MRPLSHRLYAQSLQLQCNVWCSVVDENSIKPTWGAREGGFLSWQQYSLQLNLLSAYVLYKLNRVTSGK